MKRVILLLLTMVLAFSACVTIDLSGAASKKLPSVAKFTVAPAAIKTGEAAIISWEVDNASSVSIDPGMPAVPSTGSDKVAPAATTSYVLTATNKNGTSKSTVVLTVSGSTTTVTPPAASTGLPVITSFSAAPSTVSAGGSSVLTWAVSNADSAKISGIGPVAASGSTTVYPASTTTYVIEASNGAGTASASTMIAVSATYAPPSITPPASAPNLPSILSFTASPSAISSGSSTSLSWSVLNATGVTISGVGPVPTTGSLTVSPSATMTLTLTAQNSAGSNYATTTITVTTAPTPPATGSRPGIYTFSISPSSISSGGSATVSWDIYNATSVYIDHGIGNVSSSGSTIIYPTASATYTLTAQNSYGTTTAARNIAVSAPVVTPAYSWPTISDFHCSNTTVVRGNQAKLYWTVSNADTIVIDNGIGSVGPTGATYIYPTVTTTYTLQATSGANTVAQSVTVVVTP
jgi:hypothetical protein